MNDQTPSPSHDAQKTQDQKQKRKLREAIIIAIVVVFFLGIFYIVLDANKYQAQVRVVAGEGKVGVNPTTTSLDFGDLSRGTSLTRTITLKNGTSVSMAVMIFKTGSISDLIKISKNNFKLKPGTEEKIDFTMFVPASAEIDKVYNGRIFLFKIPTF